jgi:hypothetical protein
MRAHHDFQFVTFAAVGAYVLAELPSCIAGDQRHAVNAVVQSDGAERNEDEFGFA